MPYIHIAEFNQTTKGGTAVVLPPVVEQRFELTQDNQVSEVFHDQTIIIRVKCDVACFIESGSDPEATDQSVPMAAGIEYFGILPGHRLAFIAA